VNRPLWVALAWAALLALVAAVAPAFDPVNLRDLVVRASPLDRRLRHDDRHPGAADRHLGRLAFAICGVVAGLLAREGCRCRSWRSARWAPAPASADQRPARAPSRLAGDRRHAGHARRLARGLRFATEGVWVQDLPAHFQWFGPRPGSSAAG
jgi:hypothetical protein